MSNLLTTLAQQQLLAQLNALAKSNGKTQDEVYQDVRALYEHLTTCGLAKAVELGYSEQDEGEMHSGDAAILLHAFAHAAVAQ